MDDRYKNDISRPASYGRGPALTYIHTGTIFSHLSSYPFLLSRYVGTANIAKVLFTQANRFGVVMAWHGDGGLWSYRIVVVRGFGL